LPTKKLPRRTSVPSGSFCRQALAFALVSSAFGQDPPALWYRHPANLWVTALPVGNGRLGAMVFGGIAHERIQFNEQTVWTGAPHDYAHHGAYRSLARLRELLWAGKQKEAEDALHAMQEKERERQAALTEVVDVKHQSAEDLAKKNVELSKALEESKHSEERAKENAAAAEKAKTEAVAAKSQAESLLKQEQERIKKMQAQIGSSIVDDLK